MALKGDFKDTPFVDVVQMYGAARQTVAMRVLATGADGLQRNGVFYLEDGQLVDARFGDQTGRAAFRLALETKSGEFRVEPNVIAPRAEMAEPLDRLLLEELARLDERRRGARGSAKDSPAAGAKRRRTGHKLLLSPLVAGAVAAAVGVAVGTVLLLGRGPRPQERPASASAPAKQPAAALLPPSVRGIGGSEVVLGMVSPLYGPNRERGLAMKRGLEAAFAAANEAGGVGGRRIRLVALDDGDEPERSEKAVRDLIERHRVFAVVGNAGTATSAAALAYLGKNRVVYFGAVSGLEALHRNPPDRYVFVFRPSLAEEVDAAVHYLVEVRHIPFQRLAFFGQQDDFGDSGFEALARHAPDPGGGSRAAIVRVGYKRNSVDVDGAVARMRQFAGQLDAVVMVASAEPAARFIQRLKAAGLRLVYINVSEVNATELAERLRQAKTRMADDVIVTQVVPSPESRSGAVLRYRKHLAKASTGEPADFMSLEGYLVGTVFFEGLRRAGPRLDSERLVQALQSIENLDIGMGSTMSFSAQDHQASKKVWGTVLDASWNYLPVDLE